MTPGDISEKGLKSIVPAAGQEAGWVILGYRSDDREAAGG